MIMKFAGIFRNRKAISYKGAKLSLNQINVLAQPRKTFENIQELALDIAKKGLLNPLTVARFNENACRRYIKLLNILWGAKYKTNDLIRRTIGRRKKYYYILLAGERRFRSLKLLWEKGCLDCQEKFKNFKEGFCFQRHFHCNKIEVRLCLDISPLQALFLQFSENTHMAVPPHQEAAAYVSMFKLMKRAKPDFSLTSFARQIGRNPETIKRAMWYCELPSSIRKEVEKGIISYGIALELALLQRAGLSVGALKLWLIRAIVDKCRVGEFHEKVVAYLKERASGQQFLPGIMEENREKDEKRLHIKRVVEKNTILAFWTWLYYFKKVFALFEAKLLGTADSPFSSKSPTRAFSELLEELEKLIPHFKQLLKEKNCLKSEKIIQELKNIVPQLEHTKSPT